MLITSFALFSAQAATQWKDSIELREVVVNAKDQRMLHVLAYVRDYSLLYTYTDTALMFREKWIDFMLPAGKNGRYKGWSQPRLLSAKSYFHFKNKAGLDSVSDNFNEHFTWSDWIGLVDRLPIPRPLIGNEIATDTLHGKYSAARIWLKNGEGITLKINALVDTASRRLVPGLSAFFRPAVNVFEDDGNDWWNQRNAMEFDKFKINYDFRHVATDTIYARDLDFVSCAVESQGRGRNMFGFNPYDEPFYVDTNMEMYIIDKEYIPVKEAKKWAKHNFTEDELSVLPIPDVAPPVPEGIATLISRVDQQKELDQANLRAQHKVDRRLAGRPLEGYTNKEVVLKILKNMIGLKSKHKYNSK